ncbi:MAG: hypothetical protein AB7K35_12280 [Pseudorhodoplanes sp.]
MSGFHMPRFIAAAALAFFASSAFAPDAQAVVYCKTVGVPKGCVVRPVVVTPAPVVVTPAPVVVAPATPVVVAPVRRPVRRTVIVR